MEVDPFKQIRENPDTHWGKKIPTYRDVINGIVNQLLILNCENIIIESHDEWHLVGSTTDWMSSIVKSDKDLIRLFTSFHKLDNGESSGGVRSEVFVYDFAEHVIVLHQGQLTHVKGDKSLDKSILMNFSDKIASGYAIGFTGNSYV